MTLLELENRVADLERKIAALSEKITPARSENINAWMDKIQGTFKDDAAYRDAARLGRKWERFIPSAHSSSEASNTEMIVLDTDVFSLAELAVSPDYLRLRARVAQLDPPEEVVTTVITAEEQSRGRLAKLSAARNDRELIDAYGRFASTF